VEDWMEGRVLVSVDEEETDAAAPSNDREASLRGGSPPPMTSVN
jgi:hypothetical protein